jgi:putative aminopeptidase FrvX
MPQLDHPRIADLARQVTPQMSQFLRDLIAIPSESTGERAVIERIGQEMERVGFDEVRVDGLGNILGRVGQGQHVIAMDAHIDTATSASSPTA